MGIHSISKFECLHNSKLDFNLIKIENLNKSNKSIKVVRHSLTVKSE